MTSRSCDWFSPNLSFWTRISGIMSVWFHEFQLAEILCFKMNSILFHIWGSIAVTTGSFMVMLVYHHECCRKLVFFSLKKSDVLLHVCSKKPFFPFGRSLFYRCFVGDFVLCLPWVSEQKNFALDHPWKNRLPKTPWIWHPKTVNSTVGTNSLRLYQLPRGWQAILGPHGATTAGGDWRVTGTWGAGKQLNQLGITLED